MPGNQGGSNWGSTAGNPGDGRVYVIGFNVPTIIRLLKPGETRPARRRQPGGDRQGRVSDHRRVRALPDHRQAAVHDAHRLRPEHGRDRLAEGARRRPAPAAARHHRHGIGDDRQGRPHRDRHGPGVRHRGRSQGARRTTRAPAGSSRRCRSAARPAAALRCTSTEAGSTCWSPRRRCSRRDRAPCRRRTRAPPA